MTLLFFLLEVCKMRKLKSLCRQWACNVLVTIHTVVSTSQSHLLLHHNITSCNIIECLSVYEQTIKYMWSVIRPRYVDRTHIM